MRLLPFLTASVGIIGGADGPTRVFITGSARDYIIIGVLAVVFIALIVIFIKKKKK